MSTQKIQRCVKITNMIAGMERLRTSVALELLETKVKVGSSPGVVVSVCRHGAVVRFTDGSQRVVDYRELKACR